MKKIFLAAFACVALSACGEVDRTKATSLLQAQGLTDIRLTGYSAFFAGCSEDDSYNSGFEAKDVRGNYVKGVICGGNFKGYTVRYF